jgi:hypothetical protein
MFMTLIISALRLSPLVAMVVLASAVLLFEVLRPLDPLGRGAAANHEPHSTDLVSKNSIGPYVCRYLINGQRESLVFCTQSRERASSRARARLFQSIAPNIIGRAGGGLVKNARHEWWGRAASQGADSNVTQCR